MCSCTFFFNDTATTEIYTYGHTLSLHDALPIYQALFTRKPHHRLLQLLERAHLDLADALAADTIDLAQFLERLGIVGQPPLGEDVLLAVVEVVHRRDEHVVAHRDRKRTRLHSNH